MKLFIYVDTPDIEEVAEALLTAVTAWVADCNCTAEPVDRLDDVSGERLVGLRLDTSKKAVLKTALDSLHALAAIHKIDFVIGYLDDAGAPHKVCYFGHEEGRPDIAEVGSYLGLRR